MSNIHDSAIIHPNVVMGKNVQIGAFCVIGTEAEIKGEDCPGGRVIIGDNTIIREHVTIHSSMHEDRWTRVGNDCYIQAHSHIGHDAHLGDNITIACFACVGGHTRLHEHVNMGLHSVTHQRTTIYKGTMLGANAFAKGELEPFSIYVGTPAKRIKSNDYLINKLKDKDE